MWKPRVRQNVNQRLAHQNASLYNIREHFQERNDKGKMNAQSDDAQYTELIAALRDKIRILAKKIKPKVYEYGFLKKKPYICRKYSKRK